MNIMDYAVVYHQTGTGYSASAPDLPGCIATGKTLQQTRKRMREAIALHIEGMLEDGDPLPEPTTVAGRVRIREKAKAA